LVSFVWVAAFVRGYLKDVAATQNGSHSDKYFLAAQAFLVLRLRIWHNV
jgi:hypothetical protein